MKLDVKGSKSNPNISYNDTNKSILISGRSVLKNMDDPFYRPLYRFLENYASNNLTGLSVELFLDYFNTSSHPSLIKIFELTSQISEAKIIWLYEQNDLEMMEIGQELQAYSPVKFEFKASQIA